MSIKKIIIKKSRKNQIEQASEINSLNLNEFSSNKNNCDLIKIKDKSATNCNKNKINLHNKKIIFNPISIEQQKKLLKKLQKHLLSPLSYEELSRKYSSVNIKNRSKKKLKPLNKSISESNTTPRNKILNKRKILTNINSNDKNCLKIIKNKNISLKTINLLSKYQLRKKGIISLKNNYKFIINNKHIQEFKKCISDLYNKRDKEKEYMKKASSVHRLLFSCQNRDSHSFENKINVYKNLGSKTPYNYNKSEIRPKYEYIDYLGTKNKVITRFTYSNLYNISAYNNKNDDIKNDINNDIQLNKKLKVSKIFALKDTEEYKNKNFIKILEKKNKSEKNKREIIKRPVRGIKQIIDISQKGFEKLKKYRIKQFTGIIDNAFKEHKTVMKEMDKIIEKTKELYQQNYEQIDIDYLKNIKEKKRNFNYICHYNLLKYEILFL